MRTRNVVLLDLPALTHCGVCSAQVRTAVVGGGTGEILQQGGIAPGYMATKVISQI